MNQLRRSLPDGSVEHRWSPEEESTARKLSWTSNSTASANYANYRVLRTGTGLCVRPALGKRLIGLILIALSVLFAPLAIVVFSMLLGTEGSRWPGVALGLLFVAVFFITGLRSLFARDAFTFDLHTRRFYFGNRPPKDLRRSGSSCGALSDIAGIQILSRWIYRSSTARKPVATSHAGWCSYQLNLVLKDGSRIRLLDHGNEKQLRHDASLIARTLRIEIWERAPDSV